MSEIITVQSLGTTQIEVASPESQTDLLLEMSSRRVDVSIVGGAPGADGLDAETDPGDMVPIINALLNQGL